MDEWIMHVCHFDDHVPEYVLFEVMLENRAEFEPIDPIRGPFAYRDVAQFRRANAEGPQTMLRLYLDVLKREARLYALGPASMEMLRQYAGHLKRKVQCGVMEESFRWNTARADPPAVAAQAGGRQAATAGAGGTRVHSDSGGAGDFEEICRKKWHDFVTRAVNGNLSKDLRTKLGRLIMGHVYDEDWKTQTSFPPHHRSDVRTAVKATNAQSFNLTIGLLVESGLVVARKGTVVATRDGCRTHELLTADTTLP